MGIAKVRVYFDKANNKFDVRIVGHAEGAKCGDGIDQKICDFIATSDVPGFGTTVDPDSIVEGLTIEGKQQEQKSKFVEQTPEPEAEEKEDDFMEFDGYQTEKQKDVGLNFDV